MYKDLDIQQVYYLDTLVKSLHTDHLTYSEIQALYDDESFNVQYEDRTTDLTSIFSAKNRF
jgi:hypothetical protein